jgi:hypothetical protein
MRYYKSGRGTEQMSIWHIALSTALSYGKFHRKKINTLNIVYREKKQRSDEIP